MVLEECNCDVNRGGQRILWQRGARDIVCSGNVSAKALIRTCFATKTPNKLQD